MAEFGYLTIGDTCPEGQLTGPGVNRIMRHMNETAFATARRSQRMFHKMRVQAQGRGHDGRKFREVCETVVVNAHGGLLMLNNEVDQVETIVLMNPLKQDEQECRIVFTGDSGSKGIRVGVEFLTPAPHFWGIDFEARYSRGPGGAGSSS